ncbi:MAG: UDP-N-acetylmuramate dehydrogenase [Selenomonadaceae bacterium]|nr:UDP-N-acetylmuramate dehydrogenase [Selenomonadaceae bacterium]
MRERIVVMPINENFVSKIKEVLVSGQLMLNEPMKDHTTFKIGGPVDYLILPASVTEVQQVFILLKEYGIPYTVLGNGSNVLVRDKGVRGAIVKFNSPFSGIRLEENRIFAGAGASLKDVSLFAAEHGLTGMEFAIGIPGSVGGAVFMNAGAYDGEMKNVVYRVRSVAEDGSLHEMEAADLDLGYRHSIFQTNGHAICEVELKLVGGEGSTIRMKMADLTRRREQRQPLEMPSAGSTFKRPTGYFAGTLIDQTGLKGLKVGGAQVSEKHAGFVVNTGNATAEDVLALISEVQKRVYEKHGVKLYPEVRIIGEE